MLAKITSIRSKLPTAACLSREKKRGNCEAKLLDVESDFGTTDTWRHIIHSVLRPLRRLNLIVDSISRPVKLDNSTQY